MWPALQRLEPLERIAKEGCEEAAEFLTTVYESQAHAAAQRARESGADWCARTRQRVARRASPRNAAADWAPSTRRAAKASDMRHVRTEQTEKKNPKEKLAGFMQRTTVPLAAAPPATVPPSAHRAEEESGALGEVDAKVIALIGARRPWPCLAGYDRVRRRWAASAVPLNAMAGDAGCAVHTQRA